MYVQFLNFKEKSATHMHEEQSPFKHKFKWREGENDKEKQETKRREIKKRINIQDT